MSKKYLTLDEILGAAKAETTNETTEEKLPTLKPEKIDEAVYFDWDGTEEEVSEEETRHRLATLDRYLNGIRNVMLGRRYCFLPDVEDEDRRLDEDKIRTFIREMIECHPEFDTLSADDRSFFECFLYCAITGPSVVHTEYSTLCGETQVALSRFLLEFIRLADDELFHSDDAISYAAHEECVRTFPEGSTGFTYYMNEACARISGGSEWDIYSPEELDEVIETYAEIRGEDPEEIRLSVENAWEEPSEETPDAAKDCVEAVSENETTDIPEHAAWQETAEDTVGAYTLADDTIDLPEPPAEYLQSIRRQQEDAHRECEDAWKQLIGHLPKDHCLTETYRELRRRAFSRDNSNLREEVTRMVDTYTDRHRISFLYHTGKFRLMEQMISVPYSTIHKWA